LNEALVPMAFVQKSPTIVWHLNRKSHTIVDLGFDKSQYVHVGRQISNLAFQALILIALLYIVNV